MNQSLQEPHEKQKDDASDTYALVGELELTGVEVLSAHSSPQDQHRKIFELNTRFYVQDVLGGTMQSRVRVTRENVADDQTYITNYRTENRTNRPDVVAEVDCHALYPAKIEWKKPF